jgi:hypothetical protein
MPWRASAEQRYGIAAVAFLPFVVSSSNFCSADGKTLRREKVTAKSYKRKARPCCFTTIYKNKNSKTTGERPDKCLREPAEFSIIAIE